MVIQHKMLAANANRMLGGVTKNQSDSVKKAKFGLSNQ